MSTHKNIDKICVVIVVLSLILTILFMNGEALGITKIVDEDAEQNSDSVYFTANDLNGNWDTSAAAVITLNGDRASISGKGGSSSSNNVYVNDGNVVITNTGWYVFSGTLNDGSIIVDAHDASKVWILLDGVEIHCSDDACIRVEVADKVFLTLAEGRQNTLASGSGYSDTALADGTDGAIFSHDDLTINGIGSLTVTAEYEHGISANDDLVITGGNITVKSAADAIHANDSIRICNAEITVEAGDDGIVTSNEEVNGDLYITSGTLKVTSSDDGIHATGGIMISGGEIQITAGDDGIHSDTFVQVSEGTILIDDCYEGIEALVIEVSGGEITIYPEDDGFNANGGNGGFGGFGGFGSGSMSGFSGPPSSGSFESPSGSSSGDAADGSKFETGMPGNDTYSQSRNNMVSQSSDAETYISISGGAITIINKTARDADGLDSNGDIYISGGTVLISLPGSGSNSAVDYGSESGGVAEISGGTIIACGASSMAEAFDATSTQASILYNTSSASEAGATLTIEDADGNVLLSWEVPNAFTSALVSCPQMKVGESYRVVIGDSADEITIEEVSASYGDAQSSMFDGSMNWGGMRPGGRKGRRGSDTTEEESTSDGPSGEAGQGGFPGRPGNMQGEFGGGERPDRSSDEAGQEGFSGPTGNMPDVFGGQKQENMPENTPEWPVDTTQNL